MNFSLVFVIAISIIVAVGAKQERIVGGEPARVGQLPYQAALVRTNLQRSLQCGATIISPRFVITAAHCYIAGLHVRAGYVNFDSLNGNEQEVNVKSFTIHPNYSPSRFTNDIAIVELETPLVLDGVNVSAIELPEPMEEIPHGTECIVSGWGSVLEDGPVTRALRYAYLPALADSECRKPFPNYIADSMVCAGFPAGGIDACAGDSGGPLKCDGRIQGLVSWGEGCAQPGFPGVYTQVSYYVDWINTFLP